MDVFDVLSSSSLDSSLTLSMGPISVTKVLGFPSVPLRLDIESNLIGVVDPELDSLLDINTAKFLIAYSTDDQLMRLETIGTFDVELSTGDVTKISYSDPITGQLISQNIASSPMTVGIDDIQQGLLSENSGNFITSLQNLGELLLEDRDSSIISEQLENLIQKIVVDSIPIESIPTVKEPIVDETNFDSNFLLNFARSIFDPVINSLTSISNKLEVINTSSDILVVDPETNLVGIINNQSDDLLDFNTREVLDAKPGNIQLIGLLERDPLTGQLTGEVIYPDSSTVGSDVPGISQISQTNNFKKQNSLLGLQGDNIVDQIAEDFFSSDSEVISKAIVDLAKKTLKFEREPQVTSVGEVFAKVGSKIILDQLKSIDPVLVNSLSRIDAAAEAINSWKNGFIRVSKKAFGELVQ